MVSCRYVGSDVSNVGDREFSALGERAVFSESTFIDVVLGGCPVIPESTFRRVGITQDEIEAVANEPEEILASVAQKINIVQQAYRDLRARLGGGQPLSQVISEVTAIDDVDSRLAEIP